MRKVYELGSLDKLKITQTNHRHINNFSYEKIGQKWENFLEK